MAQGAKGKKLVGGFKAEKTLRHGRYLISVVKHRRTKSGDCMEYAYCREKPSLPSQKNTSPTIGCLETRGALGC